MATSAISSEFIRHLQSSEDFWIPANVIIVSIVFKYRTRDVFIPSNGSRCTVNECRRDAARSGGFTARPFSPNAHSLSYSVNDCNVVHFFVQMNLL